MAQVTKPVTKPATTAAGAARGSTNGSCTAGAAKVLHAVQSQAMTAAEVSTEPTATTGVATSAASRATAHGHSTVPMKVMTEVAAMGPLAVAVPQIVDTWSCVIACSRTIDIARVLVLGVPGSGGNGGTVIATDGLFISPLADVGMTNNRGPRGGRHGLLAHAVYPSVGSRENLSSRRTATRRWRTVGLGSAHRACQARNCNQRSR